MRTKRIITILAVMTVLSVIILVVVMSQKENPDVKRRKQELAAQEAMDKVLAEWGQGQKPPEKEDEIVIPDIPTTPGRPTEGEDKGKLDLDVEQIVTNPEPEVTDSRVEYGTKSEVPDAE